jgi:CspA family cold shock protein
MPESKLEGIDGEIKWFDPRKGYGFIVGPEGQDIFVHFSVIEQDDGFRTLRDGEMVSYDATQGDKGWSATRACSLAVKAPRTNSVTEPKPEQSSTPTDA